MEVPTSLVRGLIALSFVTAACGGGVVETGSSETVSSADIEAACEEHSKTVCTKEIECIPDRDKTIGPADVCADRMKARCMSRFALPGTGLTPSALSACAAAMSGSGCEMYTNLPDACKIAGTLANGAGCSDGAQCQSRNCTSIENDCGTCEAPDGSEDSPCIWQCEAIVSSCEFEGKDCYYATICNGGQCTPGPKEGDSCGTFPYTCTYPAGCINGKCTLALPVCQ